MYPNNLVYMLKIGGNEPKEFRSYQMPLKLFEKIRDCEMNENKH